MVLSHSRDPFTCFTTSMDLATFWDCHRRAFAHFGGVPGSDRLRPHQDRDQTPRRAAGWRCRCIRRRRRSPTITGSPSTCWPPTGRPGRAGSSGRSRIVRDHVVAGRSFDSIAELDGAFAAWLPIRRAQVHRTHGQVIAVRAEADRAALRPLPDAAVSGHREASAPGRQGLPDLASRRRCYSVPARQVRPGQRVQLQVHPDPAHGDQVIIHALTVDGGGWLATHPRAARRGAWVVDPAHWDGLPDGHTRATIVEPAEPARRLPGRAGRRAAGGAAAPPARRHPGRRPTPDRLPHRRHQELTHDHHHTTDRTITMRRPRPGSPSLAL